MKMVLMGVAGAAALASAAIGSASAQVAPAPHAYPAPVNVEGHTRADVQSRVARLFARLDVDRDGVVTRAEAQSARPALRRGGAGGRQAMLDGRRMAHRGANFDQIDINRDGVISRQEWDGSRARQAVRRADRPQRAGRTGRGIGGFGSLRGHMFDMADANRDQRVTLQEATAAALRHFDMADVNRDGRVTREERRQMRQHMRNARGRG